MGVKMASVAILCLLLLERFMASDMDDITEPVLNGLRVLEKSAMRFRNVLPEDLLAKHGKLTVFYLYTRELGPGGESLNIDTSHGFSFFKPHLDTKVIIHGFLDQMLIADWMHLMKDEFLLLDDFNVIIVDWSSGNSIPYTKAAENTEKVGEEISELLIVLQEYGGKPEKFHLIGHSLGSHVAGYVGERIKGLQRITGLDPATYLFTNASPRSKLDRSDAKFVDVIHTDAGGIGMVEPVGHVDFYPNGGKVQAGCTASNSVKSLLEKGVVEGVRNIICSHMRAALVFTDTINAVHCQIQAHMCPSWEQYLKGECDNCGDFGYNCATMGYHMDTNRNYGNNSKYYLKTSESPPYCGYEYKITVERLQDGDNVRGVLTSRWRRTEWSSLDILSIILYGTRGSGEFQIEGNDAGWQGTHIVFSDMFLGDIHGAVIRWKKKPLSRMKNMKRAISNVILRDAGPPFIHSIHVKPLSDYNQWRGSLYIYHLCVSPILSGEQTQQGATFRNEYC